MYKCNIAIRYLSNHLINISYRTTNFWQEGNCDRYFIKRKTSTKDQEGKN